MFLNFLFFLMGLGLGGFAFHLYREKVMSQKNREAEEKILKIQEEARRNSENIIKSAHIEAKDILFKLKADFETESKERHAEQKKIETRLLQREENLDRKLDQLERRDQELSNREKNITRREQKIAKDEEEAEALIAQRREALERIASLSADEAKETLIKEMESEARHEGARLVKRIETEAREQADKQAKKILSTAIQRYAGDFVAERTVSVVQLPSEEMKGRIIGREGRNIRALEAATGIDLIVDDTPEAVILSGFDPVRREVARLSLLRLIADGRIHPARIEEIVKKVEGEVELAIKEAGEQATFDLGIHGIHPEIVRCIGRLKYRTSYAQNMLEHSLEVGFLCGMMASELGLNIKLARRAGLLHDLGKAIDHETEGPHALIGAKLAKKFGENPKIVHAISAHHEDVPPNSVLAHLVQAADGLSGARPGARREMYESYIKRLDELEKIATSFTGVSSSFAIQAGRELRVMVESDKVSDEEAVLLCRDVTKKIEENLTFPGQIKVAIIRETRAIGYASK